VESRKFLAVVALVLIAAGGAFGKPQPGLYNLKTGTVLGGQASDKVGLHGAAAVQDAATATAYKAAVDHGLIASGGADYSVQHATIPLTAPNLIGMYAAPVQLLAAPAAGKSIMVTKLAFTITRTATAFTGGGAAIVQYGNTVNGGGTQALDSTIASTVVTGSAGTTVTRNGAVISDLAAASIQAAGLFISNATAAFAAGTGTAVVDVWYVVQ
jgi:hypothetical protein